jgi:hypothetical protein
MSKANPSGARADGVSRTRFPRERETHGPPPGGPKGELSGIGSSQTKLSGISALLDADPTEVESISSATQLVGLLRDRRVDFGALRSVLDNGDLLDVAA